MMSMCHQKMRGSLWCPCVTSHQPTAGADRLKKVDKNGFETAKKGYKIDQKSFRSEVLALVGEPLGLLGRLLGGEGTPIFHSKSDFVHPPPQKNELFFESKLWENITWTLLLMLSFEVCFRCSFFNDFKWFWTSKWMCFWRGRHAWDVVNNRWIWVFVFFTQDRFFIPQKTHPGSFCEVILAPNLHQVGTRSRF